MGNENKVKKELIDSAKSRFLPEEIVDTEEQKVLYSLEEEFAKTKKNKNLFLYLFILIFIGIIVAGTLFLTNYIEEKNKDYKINIEEFDDLRLKDVLDSARQKESNADLLSVQLDIIEIKMLDAVLNVKSVHHNRELSVIMKNLPDAETNRRIKKIRAEEKRAIARTKRKFQRLIRIKRKELAALIAKAKEEEAALAKDIPVNNEDRLYKMRMKKLKAAQEAGTRSMKSYLSRYRRFIINKYNPKFRNRELNSIINSSYYASLKNDWKILEKYEKLFSSSRPYSKKDFEKIKKRIDNQNLLLKRLLKVPYINSVFPALEQIDFLTKSIFYEYEKEIRKKDREINNFRYAFDYILNKKPESGYIIDSRDPNNINFYIYKVLRIKSGETALVFRTEDEYIGKIQFVMKPYGMRAKVIEFAKNKKIRPFDKILLEFKR